MPNGLLSQILSGTAQQLLADGTPHDATGAGNPGIAAIKMIASEISDTFAHLPPAMDTHLDKTNFAHGGDSPSDFTATNWPSFWDQLAQGDNHFSGEAFDPFVMFATHHSDWFLS